MKIVTALQGSPEWLAERAAPNTYTASEVSSADGKSKYQPRAALLLQKFSGISKEIDGHTQALFNKGHAAEHGARPIAEAIIGDDLSPMTGYIEVDGMRLLASFDGITFGRDVLFEHKLYSESLAAHVRSGELEPHYTLQMDQQLLVSGASKVLFMTSDGTESNMAYMWYERPADLSHVVAIWRQFAKDLAAYSPAAEAEKVTACAVMALPALAVQIRGEVTNSNLPVFVSDADKFLAGIKTDLQTDQDFADAESNVKACKDAEDGIEQTKKAITAQAQSIDEVMRTMDLYKDKLRDVRLKLEKLVKSEKESRKLAIVSKAVAEFNDHVRELESETKPIQLTVVRPDFAGAIKGLKSLSSMQEKVDTALRDGKFAAEQVAKDVRAKLAWCKENASVHSALFPDLQILMSKPMEDFTLTITSRIEAQKKAEAEKLEAERARMEAEAKAKAEREAAAKLAEEEARIRAEERAKAEADARAKLEAGVARVTESAQAIAKAEADKLSTGTGVLKITSDKFAHVPVEDFLASTHNARPTRQALVKVIAFEFGVEIETAEQWLISAFTEPVTKLGVAA